MSSCPLKIALVCSTLNQLGGPGAHIRNLYTHLNNGEFQLTLIFCSQNEAALRDFMLEGGVNAKDMLFISNAKKRAILPFVLTMRDIFRREKFDIVHSFETQTQVLAGWAASWAGVKKFICHCEAQFLPSTISFPKRVLYRTLNFFLNSYFTRTIAVSHGIARELIKEGLRPSSRVEVVHLGIRPLHQGDTQDLTYSGLMKGAPVVGTLSRLSIEKGLDRFIRAAALVHKEIPSARFVICGQGPDERSLKALAKELLTDDCLEFRPFLFRADIKEVLQTYDIYAFPSLREGLPMTLLEAMSMGRPAVASDIDGVREVIDNGVDGILVDTADAQAFAGKIVGLCRDVPQAIDMGRRGLEKVRSSFNVEGEMRRLREIYFKN